MFTTTLTSPTRSPGKTLLNCATPGESGEPDTEELGEIAPMRERGATV